MGRPAAWWDGPFTWKILVEFTDYYKTLGIDKSASEDAIQKAYRKLAREFHPDVNKAAGSEDRFKEIGEAYEVLKDPGKRSKYDRYGAAWKQMEQQGGGFPGSDFGGFQGGGGSFYDVLEHMFGGQRSQGFGTSFGGFQQGFGGPFERRPTRGEDHEATIKLTLEEAAQGGGRTITVSRSDAARGRTIRVTIPPGVVTGQRIRLGGQGAQGPAGSGDLYLVVQVTPHKDLTLRGRDLHTQLSIPDWLAALGGEAELTTLSGKVRVKVPAGSSSGTEIRLRGQGFPVEQGMGDLYAEIQIRTPSELTLEQEEAYLELRRAGESKTEDQ
jgi:curved DNA-binding protein